MEQEKLNFNLLTTIKDVAKQIRHSELKEESIVDIKPKLDLIANYLQVNQNQAVIFVVVFVLGFKNISTDISDIINFLNLDVVDSIGMKPDIEVLLKKNILVNDDELRRKSRKSDMSYMNFNVSPTVSECVYSNIVVSTKTTELLDIYAFINKVSELIHKRSNDDIDTIELFNRVLKLEKKCGHLEPVNKLRGKLKIEDRTLLYEISDDHVNGFATSLDKTLKDIYDLNRVRLLKFRELSDKSNIMYELDYISLGESRFANDFNVSLTSNSIDIIFQDDAILFNQTKKNKNIILVDSIASKELFYEPELEREINFIGNSLTEKNFLNLQERLSKQNLSKGIAAVFFGAPGTGKTETVYQLAKTTGREILKVDISQSKSMWFGESEKRIKEIFESYKRLLKTSKLAPILLFNEADALFSQRKTSTHTQSNISNTENAMQNIILEELENFEGIMFATTNLEGNFDSAYERRFLFKVKFETPTVEVKTKIWQNKLAWIVPEFAQKLSKEFLFSGGEIDNIVRKVTMKEVISGSRPDLNEIYGYCQNESALSNKRRKVKVGFE